MMNHRKVADEYTRNNAYDFVREMKKLSNGKTVIVKLQRKTNPVNSNNINTERISELFLLLFASFVGIFVFYTKFRLVYSVEGQSQTRCYNDSMGSSCNCNDKMGNYTSPPPVNESKHYENKVCSEFNASVVDNSLSIYGNDPKDIEISPRVVIGTKDIISIMLGSFEMYCEVTPLEQQENKAELNGGRSNLTYPNLDEFRTMSRQDPGWSSPGQLVNITHRLHPDGTPYNYASTSVGAKVVDKNKEAKGASNVLFEDHDKYLRNPCSVKGKFFVIELADETLVDHVKIANFEHYSSNLKQFELYGSLSHPTELWTSLGSFTAANVKQAQCFKLSEPKWIRYLKFNLMSHYGSDFYCTLSLVEVYGVDAIEQMLEDLIVTSGNSTKNGTRSPNSTKPSLESAALSSGIHLADKATQNFTESTGKLIDTIDEPVRFDNSKKSEAKNSNHDPMPIARQQPNGRIHADVVLKILLQRVRSLELHLSVLEEYIKVINERQGDILPAIEKEMLKFALLLENCKSDIQNLLEWKQKMEEGLDDLESWKATALAQMDFLARENHLLRLDIRQIMINQTILEKKELVAFTLSFSVVCFAVLRIVISKVSAVVRLCIPSTVFHTSRGWFLMLISSCSITTLLLYITLVG